MGRKIEGEEKEEEEESRPGRNADDSISSPPSRCRLEPRAPSILRVLQG